MRCPECDAALQGDEMICPHCLARLPARPVGEASTSPPAYATSPSLRRPGLGAAWRRLPWRRVLLLVSLLAAAFVGYLMWETFFHVTAQDYLAQGDDLYAQGQFAEALAAYERASDADPDLVAAYEQAGWCYYQMRLDDAAAGQFRQALALQPDCAGAHLGLGQVLYYQRLFPEAEETLRRAVELAPREVTAHAYLGSVYFLQKRYGEAVPPLQRATALDPTDADSQEFLGRTYYELGQTEDALGPLSRAHELKPRDTEVLAYLTLTLMARGDHEDAGEMAWQLVANEPYNPRYHLYLGQNLYYLGRFIEAESQFYEALLLMQMEGVEATTYHYLGLGAYQAGHYQDAVEALESAVLLASDNPETYDRLGWSYLSLGRYDDARSAFEAALAMSPDLASAKEGLGACQ